MRSIPLIAFMALCLCSCAVNSTQSRIAGNGSMYSMLSPQHRSLVAAGEITKGMSKDAVFLAWGKPSRTSKFEEDGITKERWVYLESQPAHTTSMGIGYGTYSRYGRYGDCSPFGAARRNYTTVVLASVVFERGKVDTWEKIQSES